MELSKRQATVIILVFLLFIQLLVFYLFFVRPAAAENETLTAKTELLESEVIIAEAESNLEPVQTDSPRIIQEDKLPLTKAEDQVLLAMQSAELVSGTQIDIVEFGENDVVEPLISDEELLEEEQETEPVAEQITEPDEGLQSVAFTAEVSSPDFSSLQIFIKEMERLERIMNFEGLEFEQLTEEELLLSAPDDDKIVLQLTATAYYYNEIDDRMTQ
ncbi:hypothetical protein JMA_23460 [Jeotgalibacillus malaysiensis]|uniref:Type IV pilus assembly protein PilO n=1 Tax=Jeotgalibacillus malaysiensis TaxID=1508404 RepID=A0A0B5ASW3_9BACL|nr:hypothetical protein [Jeotgalibacillus malaysiensis]AJD91663.1 hypothetical protein JMA_23460 [Jeotgalibacillus malaysiensis]